MPIMDNGHIEYTIPDEIDSKIPDYFYPALAGELFALFGPDIFDTVDLVCDEDELDYEAPMEYPYYNLALNTESQGWVQAVLATCKKLDMMWLFDYWHTLEYYDANIFSDIMAERVIDRFVERKNDHGNSYYKYLLTKLENK